MKPFILLVVSFFIWHPVFAQDTAQPLLTVPHQWSINGARWHPNNRDFWTWNREFKQGADGSPDYQDYLNLWDGSSGSLIHQLSYHADNVEMKLDWSAGNDRVLVYSGTSLEIWDALSGSKTWTHEYDTRISGAHWDAAFKRILFWSYDDGSIHIWDTNVEKETFLAQTNLSSDLVDAKWSPDEKTILGVLTQTGELRIWNVESGEQGPIIGFPQMLYSADWNADGSRILLIGDKVVQLLGDHLELFYGVTNDQFLYRAEWSPNRKLVAVRSENEPVVEIWDTASGKVLSTIVNSGHVDNVIYEVQWSKDNQQLLTHSPDGIDIWDATTGANLFHLPIEVSSFNISWLSWSPDEQKLVYLQENSRLQVVTLATQAVLELELPSPIVMSLQSPTFTWNADGSQIMLFGVDDAARVWDTASGKLLATLQHPTHAGFNASLVPDALWSPDEQSILTLGEPDYCGGVDSCPTEAMVWHAPS